MSSTNERGESDQLSKVIRQALEGWVKEDRDPDMTYLASKAIDCLDYAITYERRTDSQAGPSNLGPGESDLNKASLPCRVAEAVYTSILCTEEPHRDQFNLRYAHSDSDEFKRIVEKIAQFLKRVSEGNTAVGVDDEAQGLAQEIEQEVVITKPFTINEAAIEVAKVQTANTHARSNKLSATCNGDTVFVSKGFTSFKIVFGERPSSPTGLARRVVDQIWSWVHS